jgi:hypothetical protein
MARDLPIYSFLPDEPNPVRSKIYRGTPPGVTQRRRNMRQIVEPIKEILLTKHLQVGYWSLRTTSGRLSSPALPAVSSP